MTASTSEQCTTERSMTTYEFGARRQPDVQIVPGLTDGLG